MPYVADVSLLVILLSKLFMSQQHTLRAAIKQNYKIMILMTKKEDRKKERQETVSGKMIIGKIRIKTRMLNKFLRQLMKYQ